MGCGHRRSTRSGWWARYGSRRRALGRRMRRRCPWRPTTGWPIFRAAVEVAAYRIATEAYYQRRAPCARASRCSVRLARAEDLTVIVQDDGRGAIPARRRDGGGTRGPCAERAAELGGGVSGGAHARRWHTGHGQAPDDGPAGRDGLVTDGPIRLAGRGRSPRISVTAPSRSSRWTVGFVVVGEAATGREAVERSLALQPDVVLMDLDMPELDGVAATTRILRAPAACRRAGPDDVPRWMRRSSTRSAPARAATCSRAPIARRSRGPCARSRRARRSSGPMWHAASTRSSPAERARAPAVPRAHGARARGPGARGTRRVEPADRRPPGARRRRCGITSNLLTKLEARDRADVIVRAREAGLGGASASG